MRKGMRKAVERENAQAGSLPCVRGAKTVGRRLRRSCPGRPHHDKPRPAVPVGCAR
jgi:hypothetical protein